MSMLLFGQPQCLCMNLKIDKFNEILFFLYKLLKINQLKAKQTYIERLSFQCASYL
jgi:predicted transcriptional regulator YheO